jgi:hypothetical protein
MNKNIRTMLMGYEFLSSGQKSWGYELLSSGLEKSRNSGFVDDPTYTALKSKLDKINPRSANAKETVRQAKGLLQDLEAYFSSLKQNTDPHLEVLPEVDPIKAGLAFPIVK